MKKRFAAFFLSLVTALSLTGCGAAPDGGDESQKAVNNTNGAETEAITLYPYNAGLQSGPVTGWLGEYLAEKGISLEVIPYSEEKTQAMLASGSLPDIIIFNSATIATAALEADMLLPLEDYLDQLPHIAENEILAPALSYMREYFGTEDGKLVILPFGVGDNSLARATDTDRYAIKLNWDVYESIGAPEFETLEDIIPILKEMQTAYPQNEDGMNVYGMNLFSDFDTSYFYNMTSIFSILGYDWKFLPYGIEYDVASGEAYSIFRDDSVYKRGAKFMYELNQQGLLDPDSLTQERATADSKVSSGAAVAGWAGVPGWTSSGYLPVTFGEFKPAINVNVPYGQVGIAISAETDNIDACLKFIDMLADFDVLRTLYNGPQGERWDVVDGKLVMTDKLMEQMDNGGSFILESGEEYSLFNFVAYILNMGNIDEEYGEAFPMTLWTDYQARQNQSEEAVSWSKHYGCNTFRELMASEGIEPANMDSTFVPFLTVDDDAMKLTLAALKDVIVPGTWELIYAADDAEFEQIWNRIKTNAEGLGIDSVIEYKVNDIAQAKEMAQTFTQG